MTSDQNTSQLYIPHSFLDGLPVKLSFVRVWDENNILSQFIDDSVTDRDERESYLITSQLIINGLPINQPKPLRTLKRNQSHEDNVFFPVSYKDLCYNSIFSITIYSAGKSFDEMTPIGSTTFPLFDENLRLREGKHNLLIWPNVMPDTSFDSRTPGLVQDKNIDNLNFCTSKIEYYEAHPSQSQENTENLALQNLKLKLFYCYKIIPAPFLEISVSCFPKPVLFEDMEYQFDEQQLTSFGGGYNMSMSSFNTPILPQKYNSLQGKTYIIQNNFSDCMVYSDYNSELERPDPVYDMHLLVYRDEVNPETLKPTKQEHELMIKLYQRPIVCEMKSDERLLFWRFRFFLRDYGEALPRFLHSVDWGNKLEDDKAMKLLKQWNSLQIADALYLLSSFTSANELFTNKKNKKPIPCMIEVRKFAVASLAVIKDEQIEEVLLQLVQALKYEETNIKSALVQFLFKRAQNNKNLATLFYWYLNVEQELSQNEERSLVTDWYKTLFDEFRTSLEEDDDDSLWQIISKQISFRSKIQKQSQFIRTLKKDRNYKVQELRSKLALPEYQDTAMLPEHPCCLNPNYILQRAIPQDTTIFSSAMAPTKFCFETLNEKREKFKYMIIYKLGDDLRQDQLVMQVFSMMDNQLKVVNQDMKLLPYKILACSKNDGFLEFVPETRTIQDILQKQKVIEYLKDISDNPSNSFYQELLPLDKRNTYNSALSQQYIKELIEANKKEPFGINRKIMQNYVLSSAGYCVLTYFLGIGDRHLENLLINDQGKMFHIDFGFILGKDPKPYPPPFKLCKQMVEGMGGMGSEYYSLFKQQCTVVYVYLRKYAKLIITLFQMMSDAGIKDYSSQAIETMYQKFRLDDSDNNAEIHFLGIVEESVSSLFPLVTDITHKIVSYWR